MSTTSALLDHPIFGSSSFLHGKYVRLYLKGENSKIPYTHGIKLWAMHGSFYTEAINISMHITPRLVFCLSEEL